MSTDPKKVLDRQYLEMRWRILSLAADFDRVDRAGGAAGGSDHSDPRLNRLQKAVALLLEPTPGRAERVQILLSDQTPPPAHTGGRS
jgi:hypothetical protein